MTASSNTDNSGGALSTRGQRYQESPAWISAFVKAVSDPYDPVSNPDGVINLGVAENVLCSDLQRDKVNEIGRTHDTSVYSFRYGDFNGLRRLREQIKHLFERRLFTQGACSPSPGMSETQPPPPPFTVEVDHIALGNGSGPVIEQLGSILMDPDQCILIPTPMYMGFEMDLQKRIGCKILHVPMRLCAVTDDGEYEYEFDFDVLDSVFEKHGGSAHVRALMWTNPHNPTGQVFSASVTKQVLQWCLSRGVHVIADEVYALGVFDPEPVQFVSAMTVAQQHMQELGGQELVDTYVHMVYSFSKDFCLNGWRVGVLYTRNTEILKSFGGINYFSCISNHTQEVLADMISDHAFVDRFLATCHERMRKAHATAKAAVNGLPVIRAQAGMFMFVNLLADANPANNNNSTDKRTCTTEDEQKVWYRILDNARVYMTPGFVLRTEDPGWFRCCFTCAEPEQLLLGWQRVMKELKSEH